MQDRDGDTKKRSKKASRERYKVAVINIFPPKYFKISNQILYGGGKEDSQINNIPEINNLVIKPTNN